MLTKALLVRFVIHKVLTENVRIKKSIIDMNNLILLV